MKATARANANIALVKYWGKRDATLNLPARGSLSLTLEGLTTTTTVEAAERDELILGGQVADAEALAKALKVVDLVRAATGRSERVRIVSENSFPTGAGLASSASGLAALTVAAAGAFGLDASATALSRIARVGSGSACRSLFGGFVQWHAGTRDDGQDSVAEPLFPASHWDLAVVVAVVSPGKKAVGSTSGMTHTRLTSPFHQPFLDTVDGDLADAKIAIAARDLAGIARVAERSSLRMHAAMQAADPALVYLAPESWIVIQKVRALQADGLPVFFTADAGPNIKVFCDASVTDAVQAAMTEIREVRRIVVARPGEGATRIA